jgi:hypothetical protein
MNTYLVYSRVTLNTGSFLTEDRITAKSAAAAMAKVAARGNHVPTHYITL